LEKIRGSVKACRPAQGKKRQRRSIRRFRLREKKKWDYRLEGRKIVEKDAGDNRKGGVSISSKEASQAQNHIVGNL